MSIHGQVLRSNVDMTQGRPLNVIFSFALPLLMGNLFNQLYNVVDTAIVGRALGADALAQWAVQAISMPACFCCWLGLQQVSALLCHNTGVLNGMMNCAACWEHF